MPVYSEHLSRREQARHWHSVIFSLSFRVSLLVAILAFGFLYVIQTNAVSTKGYQLHDLEKQIASLQADTRRLDVAVAEQQSLRNLEERLRAADLVAVDHFEYAGTGGSLAANR